MGPLRRRAARHFASVDVLREDDANTFGVESRSAFQVRGNGTLVLTADELLFAQWVPDRLVRIPRAQITEVTTTRSWLGKTIGRQLLLVRWTAAADGDAIALWVKDLDGWIVDLTAPGAGTPASH
jgi:GNAT superfamily N-acetyltransferase